jgi:hypothetical protein
MKHSIGAGLFVVLALFVRFGPFRRFGVGINLHATYFVIGLPVLGFWLLMAIAAVWLLIGAYLAGHHS